MSQPFKINRRWLALWLQQRRRMRAAADFLKLSSDGHGRLTWTLAAPSAWPFNIYKSADGVTWGHSFEGAEPGASAADESGGGAAFFRVCQCDWDGNDILPYSNIVYSDGL